jgi:hypothetical protein
VCASCGWNRARTPVNSTPKCLRSSEKKVRKLKLSKSSASIPVFLMFASISRGSSRIRQSYICSSCLSNLARSTQLSILPGEHTCRIIGSSFSTTSSNSQGNEEQSGKDVVESAESPDSKSSRPRQKSESITKSRTTLAALRKALLSVEEATSDNVKPKASELQQNIKRC